MGSAKPEDEGERKRIRVGDMEGEENFAGVFRDLTGCCAILRGDSDMRRPVPSSRSRPVDDPAEKTRKTSTPVMRSNYWYIINRGIRPF